MNLTVDPGALLTIVTLVAGGTIYSFLKSRHIERMEQLGMSIPIDEPQSNYLEIKMGSLFIGIGIGILLAFIFDHIYSKSTTELYSALIFLFGGIGLIISHIVVNGIKRKV